MNLSVKNFVLVGGMAVLFIIVLKVLVNKYETLKPLETVTNAI